LIISGFLDILTKGGERHFLKKCPSLLLYVEMLFGLKEVKGIGRYF